MPDREKVIKGLEWHIREIAIGKSCYQCPYLRKQPCETILMTDVLSLLKEQEPTVDAEPVRHGRWVRLDMHIGEPDFKCTVCNTSVHVPTCMGEPMYEYCPVCGAVMDLEEVKDAEKNL